MSTPPVDDRQQRSLAAPFVRRARVAASEDGRDSGACTSSKPLSKQAAANEQAEHGSEQRSTSMNSPRLVEDERFLHSHTRLTSEDVQAKEGETEQDDGGTYVEASEEQILPPPDFKPFFTLIHDPETGEHYHPSVHYIFSDDDPDPLTTATLEAVQASDGDETQQQDVQQTERFLIVDIDKDGKTVQSAVSLSPDWQSLKTETKQAPSWGDGGHGIESRRMLQISGQEIEQKKKTKTSNLEEMMKTFGERLSSLDEVLGKDDPTYDEPIASLQEHSGSSVRS